MRLEMGLEIAITNLQNQKEGIEEAVRLNDKASSSAAAGVLNSARELFELSEVMFEESVGPGHPDARHELYVQPARHVVHIYRPI